MPIVTELLIQDDNKPEGFYVHPQPVAFNGIPPIGAMLDLAPFGYPGQYIVESKVLLMKSGISRLYLRSPMTPVTDASIAQRSELLPRIEQVGSSTPSGGSTE